MSLNHQNHFRVRAPSPWADNEPKADTHTKRFATGRYNGYVLRLVRFAYDDWYYCDWFRPGAKESVDPPLDIQDTLTLWEKTPAWHGMSPTEFVWRTYSDVP